MNTPVFSFTFSEILGTSSVVYCTDSSRGCSYTSRIGIDDLAIVREQHDTFPEIAADIIDIAAAVHFADRLVDKSGDAICEVNVTLPLRAPHKFHSHGLLNELEDILFWYTHDHWLFHFVQRIGEQRAGESQIHLPFREADTKATEVALWSGGLDSAAGLYNRLREYPQRRFLLVGTGSNKYALAIQRNVAHEFAKDFPDRAALIQIPIEFQQTLDLSKNRAPRARGFVFLLIGAVTAYLEKTGVLYVYENGIGAINLPFRNSEIGLDHSRSVHPISLYRVGNWLSRLLESSFEIHNPFLYSTKAQMCRALSDDGYVDVIRQTHSCDRLRHEYPRQCGYCSSCLLRRYALAASGIADPTLYAYSEINRGEHSGGNHLLMMNIQINTLSKALASGVPWQRLSQFYQILPQVAETQVLAEKVEIEAVTEKIVSLYKNYITEWEKVAANIEKEQIPYELSSPQLTASTSLLDERMIELWN